MKKNENVSAMNSDEFLKSIKEAERVFVWTEIVPSDGTYVEVTKDNLVSAMEREIELGGTKYADKSFKAKMTIGKLLMIG